MKVYTVEEVAEILKVSIYTVKNLIREKKIKTLELGVLRVSEKALNDYLEGN